MIGAFVPPDMDWRELARALGHCSFLPGLPAKRIARNAALAAADPRVELSPRMIRALVFIGQRYRRQLSPGLREKVLRWLAEYLAAELAGGGGLRQQPEPRAGGSHEPNRPNPARPALPLQGRDTSEGLPLWSRVPGINPSNR